MFFLSLPLLVFRNFSYCLLYQDYTHFSINIEYYVGRYILESKIDISRSNDKLNIFSIVVIFDLTLRQMGPLIQSAPSLWYLHPNGQHFQNLLTWEIFTATFLQISRITIFPTIVYGTSFRYLAHQGF